MSGITANQLSDKYFKINNTENTYHNPLCCYPAYYKNHHLLNEIVF